MRADISRQLPLGLIVFRSDSLHRLLASAVRLSSIDSPSPPRNLSQELTGCTVASKILRALLLSLRAPL